MSNGGKKFPFKRKWAFARKVASDRQLTVAVFLLVTAVLALFFGVFSYKHPEKSPVNGRFALSFQPVDENMKYNLDMRDPALVFAVENPVTHDNAASRYRASIRQPAYPAAKIAPPTAEKHRKLAEKKIDSDITFLQRISPETPEAVKLPELKEALILDPNGRTAGKLLRNAAAAGTTVIEVVQNGYIRRTSLLKSCGDKTLDGQLERFLRTNDKLIPGRYSVHWHTAPATKKSHGEKKP
ncbi:MAG: hypothetical protein IKD22_02640 [Lentisphaeria bacterium]|nr:hypothetical protein [Lentisphaeria bacterium]